MVQKPNDGHVHVNCIVSLAVLALAVAMAASLPLVVKPDGTCLSALHPRCPPAADATFALAVGHFNMRHLII